MEVLQVENFSAGYGKQDVVKEVSFSIEGGEVAGVFGENGCGKTTLLKGIAGLGVRGTGDVYINGQDIMCMSVKERARHISMFFSGAQIPEGLLAQEVLEMGWYGRLRFLQFPGENLKKEKEGVVGELGLEKLISERFDVLSQGQKQMVLLGRMLLQNTPVFLMDEPDNSLDFKHRHELLQKMRKTARQKGRAGLMVLHDPSLAMSYCDRVYLMKNGRFFDVVVPEKEGEEQIAEKLKEITGNVQVTKQGASVIISP